MSCGPADLRPSAQDGRAEMVDPEKTMIGELINGRADLPSIDLDDPNGESSLFIEKDENVSRHLEMYEENPSTSVWVLRVGRYIVRFQRGPLNCRGLQGAVIFEIFHVRNMNNRKIEPAELP